MSGLLTRTSQGLSVQRWVSYPPTQRGEGLVHLVVRRPAGPGDEDHQIVRRGRVWKPACDVDFVDHRLTRGGAVTCPRCLATGLTPSVWTPEEQR